MQETLRTALRERNAAMGGPVPAAADVVDIDVVKRTQPDWRALAHSDTAGSKA
jgi:hypothetical protein